MATNIPQQPDKHPMRWLDSDQGASGVLLAAHRLIQLESSVKKSLPSSLTRQISVTGFEQGVLEITTYNSAQTAKLRQMKKTICERMMRDGWNVKDVKLRISAATAPGTKPPERPKQLRPLQSEDLDHFEALVSALKPGQLADSVLALLKRHKG